LSTFLFFGVRIIFVLFNDWPVVEKFKDLNGITVIQVVKENATQAPPFPTVLDKEVVVGSLFKFGIVFWIVTIAHFFVRAMEVFHVLLVNVRRSDISATTKPPCTTLGLKVPARMNESGSVS
jgi:hypothetical protein